LPVVLGEEDDDEDDAEPEPVSITPAPRLASIQDEEDDEDSADTPETYAGQTEPARPINGKFNSLWASPGPNAAAMPALENEEDELNEDDEEEVQVEGWARPPIDILQNVPEGGVSEEDMQATAETIKRTLGEYNVEVEIGQVRPGPTVTMYGLIPGWVRRYKEVKETDKQGQPKLDASGKPIVSRVETKTRVKVDTILAREKDLALALKTPSIRIQTPVMGESMVGIEVPNRRSSVVSLRAAMESPEFQRLQAKAHLPIALGKGSGGEAVVIDLTKMPHLLVAGATGSGKSVCLNAIVSCLIMEKTPAELRLLLIDPKRVELTPYNGIPHLLTPVVVETDKVVGVLKGMINEMLDRYRRMEQVGARNIEAYNRKSPVRMPYLVAAVDELADLMMTAAFEVEQSLCRLAQLGRATGIHLIVATQRPSVDVVTGLIKANFPSRISFAVSSQVDSRTILDTAGAERLLGRGDMLYLPLDASMPIRAQGVFISDRETEGLISFWQTTPRAPSARIRIRAVAEDRGSYESEDDDGEGESADKLLEKAVELAKTHSKLSTSLLQRRLRIGYPRAARLMDQLEERGIVGPSDGSKSRDVIMNKM
jgi:S-DNA-T family DNA segregation ATPase FtsK/SpoIIIE